MEWAWSTDGSFDMGAPEEAREKLAAIGVTVVQTELEINMQFGAKVEEGAEEDPKRTPLETVQLLMDSRPRSVSPSPMLMAIEDQLKQVGLHKDRPDRAFVVRPTVVKNLARERVAKG